MKARVCIVAVCWILMQALPGLPLADASQTKVYKSYNTGSINAAWVLEHYDQTAEAPGSSAWLSYSNVKS